MNKIISLIKRFIKSKNKFLIIKTLFLTAIVRCVILIVPFKNIKKYIGVSGQESDKVSLFDPDKKIIRIKRVVNKLSKHTPWESKCLVKAMVAQHLLVENNFETTLYLGVGKDDQEKMVAHAWLRCGDIYVTGYEEIHKFVEVAKFKK